MYMKILLAAINAKYIHSNLGVYSLKAYADRGRSFEQRQRSPVELGEYTINHQMDRILQDIYKRKPDFVGFSCYIWNIQYVRQLVRNLAKVLPGTVIWLGGPEVSYDGEKILEEEPAVAGVMLGEGEETFLELIQYYDQAGTSPEKGAEAGKTLENAGAMGPQGAPASLARIQGITFRTVSGEIETTGKRPLLPMDQIPFPYKDLGGMENRILYYESSRGCPYSCSYCLSSIEKTVRFRSLSLVKEELDFFLKNRVRQVKFVDRTFNCSREHCLEIWKYLLDHDNGVTNFHFEISADLINDQQLDIMRQMRPGLIQLEIGVQTANPATVREIRRTMDLERLEQTVGKVREYGNIHQHLDLIAGLPFEDIDSFRHSFDRVYRMRPDQLQLGFLKVLKGSHMAEAAEEYGLNFHQEPPYEVLSTKWLGYGEVLELKAVEEMTEVYYNSGQFCLTLREMEKRWQSPYEMFLALGKWYEARGLMGISHSRLARYEILWEFLGEKDPEHREIYRDLLMVDLYLRENVKSRPGFARDQSRYKTWIRDFFIAEKKNPRYLKGYEGYDSRQMSNMAHVEAMGNGRMVLFDYRNRDPLSYNAKAVEVGRLDHG